MNVETLHGEKCQCTLPLQNRKTSKKKTLELNEIHDGHALNASRKSLVRESQNALPISTAHTQTCRPKYSAISYFSAGSGLFQVCIKRKMQTY